MELQTGMKLALDVWFQSRIYSYTGSKYVNDQMFWSDTEDILLQKNKPICILLTEQFSSALICPKS